MDNHAPTRTTTTGTLIPLRTLDEIRTALRTVDVYTIPIPQKSANSIISALRTSLPSIQDLQHLRRLVNSSFLPPTVLSKIPTPTYLADTPYLHLLLCAAPDLSLDTLRTILSSLPEFAANPQEVTILPVPYYQPTSAEQAQLWSKTYWPTVYRRGNPFGPHPAIVSNTAATLTRAGEYVALARAAGKAAATAKDGIAAGAVIVDPTTDEIVAVAGDARFHCPEGRSWGNPLDHAVMRVIAMVAQKRLPSDMEVAPENPLRGLNAIEEKYFRKKEKGQEEGDDGGYLCHNMHVYLSHEPCTMCAMALLHSRVGAVVFAQRMKKTGALVAEIEAEREGLGLGLFWRPELNWKYLCWRWEDEFSDDGLDIGEEVSV